MSDTNKKYENSKNNINQDKSENHRTYDEDSITSNLGEVPEKIPDFTPGDGDNSSEKVSENNK